METSTTKQLFSKDDLKKLIIPLLFEQALAITVGMADTVMISSAGEAAGCRDHHIDHSIMKYVRFNFTEKQGNNAVTEHHDQNRYTDCNAYR